MAAGWLVWSAFGCSSGDDSAQIGGGAGTTGTGGAAATGGGSGTTATGGSTGTGGTAEAGPLEAGASDTILFDFNTTLQGLTFNTFHIVDGGTIDITDAGVVLNLSNVSPLSIDRDVGNPEPGSVKAEIPFTDYNQFADFVINPPVMPMDLSHKVLFVKIRLDSGFSPNVSAPGGVIFYVQSTGFIYAQLAYQNVAPLVGAGPGPWVEYRFNLDQPDVSYLTPDQIMAPQNWPVGYDPASIIQIGIKFHTGGGVNQTVPPSAAVFHIDTIGDRPAPTL
jgi:hypothetical protein